MSSVNSIVEGSGQTPAQRMKAKAASNRWMLIGLVVFALALMATAVTTRILYLKGLH